MKVIQFSGAKAVDVNYASHPKPTTMFLCSAIHTYSDGAAIGSSLGLSFQGHFNMQPAPGIKQSTLQLAAEVLSLLWKTFVYTFSRGSKT